MKSPKDDNGSPILDFIYAMATAVGSSVTDKL